MMTLLRQRNFALLWSGGLISLTGDWLLSIGLSFYVYTLTGSALATSIALITALVPSLLLGSVAGVLVDRWDRRRTLIICNLVLAIGLLPLLAVHSRETIWIVYVIQFFEACIAQFVFPAESALIPVLVGEGQLVTANALQSVNRNVPRLLGGAIGGLLIGFLGLDSVTLFDAASFLFVCVTIWLIRMPLQSQVQSIARNSEGGASASLTRMIKSLMHDWLEGVHMILNHRLLIILFIVVAIEFFGEGVFSVLLVVFVRKMLDGGSVVYGSLMSLQAIGSLIGAAIMGQVGNRIPSTRLLGICALLFGIIDLLIVDMPLFVPGLFIVMALFVLVGLPATGFSVSLFSLFQSSAKNMLQGRLFGMFSAVTAPMIVIGMILAGVLGDRLGPVLLLNIQGGGYTLSGVFAIVMLWRMVEKDQSAPF